jgi:Mg2+-importing ATPase
MIVARQKTSLNFMSKFKKLLTHSSKQRGKIKLEKDTLSPIVDLACLKKKELLKKFEVKEDYGLEDKEAKKRLNKYGKNEAVTEKELSWIVVLLKNLKDPLNLLLIVLSAISFFTSDLRSTIMIISMVVLSVAIKFFQEIKSDKAAKELKALVKTNATVIRSGKKISLPITMIVPGDIVSLSAGDMVPADVLLLSDKDLFVNQSTLNGESIPSEKKSRTEFDKNCLPLDLENICFLGTNIESGSATALVVATGKNTYLGAIAKNLTAEETPTNFDIGLKKFTYLILAFILIMAPLVFFINWFSSGNLLDSILFSLAVAVGLAPEMLPMIVTVNLSKGAMSMAKKKVVVKHLASVQNFGAMDILCTDKTGTITEGKVILEKFLNTDGEEDKEVLKYAYLNSFFQTGLSNLMDEAVLKHKEINDLFKIDKTYQKIDEIPFDFGRRRMSVVVKNSKKENILITKGAVEEVVGLCSKVEKNGKIFDIKIAHKNIKKQIEDDLNSEGFRVVAVAYKNELTNKKNYAIEDEKDLILIGFLAFLDPPKATAKDTIARLKDNGIKVIVLTGDNVLVSKKICAEVGLKTDSIITGSDIEMMDESQLKIAIQNKQIFAKLTPLHKERIVQSLRSLGHTVGFMGDGINDAPALRAADIGISVDTAADIAKESSDIILLEKSLSVLCDGVRDGRKILGNIIKYIEMAASSNFGNMFSVVGASIMLPFLPMLPIQILVNNILYDISQTSIPTDQVDEEYLQKPRTWNISRIKKFILYMGPVSSVFDFATFFVMIFFFNAMSNPSLFQTGWFVESIVSQTLIIYIIRTNKIPFIQSWPSKPLLLTTLIIAGIGMYLPFSFINQSLGLSPLPIMYWKILAIMIVLYFGLTQIIKNIFIKKYSDN